MQLVSYKIGEGEKFIPIPEGAAITITENCGCCDWCKKGKSKSICWNPRILAARPYADIIQGDNRIVVLTTRPVWCPL